MVPAKINLSLMVGPRRADGFHELLTVYHAIDLYDEVVASPSDDGAITLSVTGEGEGELPLDRGNLAVLAAEELASSRGLSPSVRLLLRKRIPVAGGLAGGSADAAAVLVACAALWGLPPSRSSPDPTLVAIAARLGSDVPFLLYGGTALGTGRGERIVRIQPGNPGSPLGRTWHWVVVPAEGGLSTPAVYAELDRLRETGQAPQPVFDAGPIRAALHQDDPVKLGAALHNDLQAAAISLRPELGETLAAGLAAGAVAGMVSGSGPTCVFLAADQDHAESIAKEMTDPVGRRPALTASGPVRGARSD